MKLDAVIFDWGGTLTPWHTVDPMQCWLAVTGDEALAARLRAAEDAAWVSSRDHHRSAHIDDVLSVAGVELTHDQRRRYFSWWDAHSVTDPAAPEMLRALRQRGLRIGILSNTIWPRAEHERIFGRDGVSGLIDGAVYSSEIAWTKPHPEAFRAAMAAVGVSDPARSVFVGDRLFDDIYGAQQAGMKAVHIPHSEIPVWQTTGVEGTPDAVITGLYELPSVIDGWL
ncbi:HAD family hydrolase [Jatrophihabitans telluris]|uniref:HAD family hydrolase n=1 Tax=Jatrophihabitans telluris TaxID=2038343 RepID=A0ABY4R5M9_9ACTN|nr:HAD family hydrolase [Jatrophihabitans telluris]UQX90039.1 HAD family hydrolase [Jatrophihabitans telluris]